MPAGTWTLDLCQGESYHRIVAWTTRDPVTGSATPVDLAGAAALLQVRRAPDDPTVLLELSTANGRITVGAEPGTLVLALTAEETAALAWPAWQPARYDLFVAWPADGRSVCLLTGAVTLRHAVSRLVEVGA